MEKVLKHLNYQSNKSGSRTIEFSLYVINNPDGRPRWYIPTEARYPYFLKFYYVSGLKATVFSLAVQLIYLLRIQAYFLKKITINTAISKEETPLIDLHSNKEWALFTGTVGPNNKSVLYVKKEQHSYFYKIANTISTHRLLQNEHYHATYIKNLEIDNLVVPEATLKSPFVLELSDISEKGVRTNKLCENHFKIAKKITEKTINSDLDQNIYSHCQSIIEELLLKNDSRIPAGLVRKLNQLNQHYKHKNIKVAYAHSDFTPWNSFSTESSLLLYDLELAGFKPLGFDVFHYYFQKGILSESKKWKEIKRDLEKEIPEAYKQMLNEANELNFNDYLVLYLLVNSCNQLKIFAEQEQWHPQVKWLLSTWTVALSDCSSIQHISRANFIRDCFDYLALKEYSAIKFPNLAPEKLSQYSDIDLCMSREDAEEFIENFYQHPLVVHMEEERKSFMHSVRFMLTDGSILSFDLIWNFLRKNVQFLDAAEVLRLTETNIYGVKLMDLKNLARYVGHFYNLNGGIIPDKYQPFFIVLKNSQDRIDQLLYRQVVLQEDTKEESIYLLKQKNRNSFLKVAYRTLGYAIDKIREIKQRSGMIITFSGVDGAGKSTIIEKTKFEFEKKLRKKVVVIRHRPSLLPILSAWTKGKEAAEQEAANTLPRQGSNKNVISSLLRFAYYYVDYVVGQFYVLFKYVFRGYVVLYDRYYFDFIHDSKRSNIHLPKWIAKLGYALVISPDVNFFLYAEPEVILKRKKELDSATIKKLTHLYLTDFNRKNKRSNHRYFPIENIELDSTMRIIMNTSTKKLASA